MPAYQQLALLEMMNFSNLNFMNRMQMQMPINQEGQALFLQR
jgi:hypothetical protein